MKQLSLISLLTVVVLLLAGLGLGWFDSAGRDAAAPSESAVPAGAAAGPGSAAAIDLVPAATGAEGPTPIATGAGNAAGADLEGTRIAGRVLAPDGAPRDSTLEVFALRRQLSPQQLTAVLDGVLPPGAPLAQARTRERLAAAILARAPVAADGSFEIDFPQGMRAGFLTVQGRYLYMTEAESVSVASGATVTLRPRLGVWITGTVTDEASASAPLAGVRITLTPDGGRTSDPGSALGGPPAEALDLEMRSGPSGGFEWRAVDAETTFTLRAIPDKTTGDASAGPAAASRHDVAAEPGGHVVVDLSLDTGGRARGIVVDPSGLPIAGATVELSLSGRFFGFDDLRAHGVRSDSEGKFEIASLPYGPVKLRARHPRFLESRKLTVDVPEAGLVEGVRLELDEGAKIAGRVTDEGGAPVEGVRVEASFDRAYLVGMSAFSMLRGDKADCMTDADGEFELLGLGGGPFAVDAVRRIEVADDVETTLGARRNSVRPGTTGLVLVLRPPLGVHGRIVDTDGEPVQHVSLVAENKVSGDLSTVVQASVRADHHSEDGAFFLEGLEEGEWHLSAESDGYRSVEPVVIQLPADTEAAPVEIVVERTVTVRGRVLSRAGEPVAGARIRVDSGAKGWMAPVDTDPLEARSSSRDDGTFEMEGLLPGTIALYASAKDHARSESVSVDAEPGAVTEDVILQLTEGGYLTGLVLDDDGDPAPGRMIVMNHLVNFSSRGAFSDATGTFAMDHLAPGTWQLIAMDSRADWSASNGNDVGSMMSSMDLTQATIIEGESTHVVIGEGPEDPVRVRGKVEHAGEPYEGALISFYPEGSKLYERLAFCNVEDDGTYEVELDGPGSYVVSIQKVAASGTMQSTIEFNEQVPAAPEHRADFEIPVGRISGRVLGPDRAPAVGARITVTIEGSVATDSFFGGHYTEITTDENGEYQVDGLRPDTYRLSAGGATMYNFGAAAQFGRVTRGGLRLGEGEWLRDVDMQLPAPGTIVVSVKDGGRPVAQATVFVRDADGRLLEPLSVSQTDGAGNCSYSGVAPGQYTVTARTTSSASLESASVTVPAGGSAQVSLAIEPGTILWIKVKDGAGEALRARVQVIDEEGRDVTSMFGMQDLQVLYLDGAFSPTEHRLGPLPPGKYKVYAEANGKRASKTVRLRGESEEMMTLRVR